MIMYAWKQFWNNLRNWDDAVFGDSNRPRDEDWFKLRPWLQSDKWTFRDVNKKTWFSQIHLKWYTNCDSSVQWKPTINEIPIIKKKWTKETRLETWYPSVFRSDASYEVWAFDNEFWNNPQYKIVEWNFKYYSSDGNTNVVKNKNTACLEFAEDWLYFVQSLAQYYFSYNNPSSYNTNNAYLNKERIWLMVYDKENDFFIPSNVRCQRAVWNGDSAYCDLVTRVWAWTRMLPYWAFYQPTWNSWMFLSISATKLW